MAIIATQRATQSANCYPNSTMKPQHPFGPKIIRLLSRTNHLMAAIEQPPIPHTIYESSWTKRPVRTDQSMGPEDRLQRGIMVTTMIMLIEYHSGINSRQQATTRPDTEGLCTPCASPMRCWCISTRIQTREYRGIRRNNRSWGLD